MTLYERDWQNICKIERKIEKAIYDCLMSEPGDVKIYKQVKEKIKVDNLTGQERVVDTWWIIDLELYKADGSLYNSRQHTLKLK